MKKKKKEKKVAWHWGDLTENSFDIQSNSFSFHYSRSFELIQTSTVISSFILICILCHYGIQCTCSFYYVRVHFEYVYWWTWMIWFSSVIIGTLYPGYRSYKSLIKADLQGIVRLNMIWRWEYLTNHWHFRSILFDIGLYFRYFLHVKQ